MQDGDVVFNNAGLTHHDAGGMIEHDPRTNYCRGVKIHAQSDADLVLEKLRQGLTTFVPQPVGDPVRLQRVITLEEKKRG